ncbi:MAG: hypothetical protein NC177_18320, partial [Ruminococcus flavefaciens]|nr:hypothetical protein [Ruminococcus flavefaciens]
MRKGLIPFAVSLIICTLGSCKKYDEPVNESGGRDKYNIGEIYNEVGKLYDGLEKNKSELGKERWDWDDSVGDECALKVIDCFINKDSET